MGKSSQLGMSFSLTLEKGLFLSVYVDDKKLAGKTQNINPTWKILMKNVDLGEPTSLLDQCFLGCTQKECQISKDIVDIITEVCSNRGFLPGLWKITRNKSHGET